MARRKTHDSVRLGKHIRVIRKQRDLLQEDLARALAIDTGTMSRIENGYQLPSLKQIKLLARKLQVLPSRLVAELDPVGGHGGGSSDNSSNHAG